MKNTLIVLAVICSSLQGFGQITITGNVFGIPAKKIFLIDAYSFDKIDSTGYENNQFTFFLANKKREIEPKLVSIAWFIGKLPQILAFNNPHAKFFATAFMLEDGITTIDGKATPMFHNASSPLNITSGEQTDDYFKTYMLDFGYMSAKDPPERKKKIDNFLSIIKTYPNSYYLLNQIYNYRQTFNANELSLSTNSFDLRLRSSQRGVKLLESIKTLSHSTNLATLLCKTPDGKITDVFKNKSNTLVLVFWASWCGPCRNEIPYLKQLYAKYSGKVVLASISMDINNEAWQKALKEEKMSWAQYIVNNDRDKLKDNFRFSYIPVILVLKNQKIVKRFDGFNETGFSDMESLLNSI